MTDDHSHTDANPTSVPAKLKALYNTKWVGWIVDIGIVLLIFAAVSWWQTRDHIEDGQLAPAFSLQPLANSTSDTMVSSESLKGKKTVLYFWAPWCTVCKAQSGIISSLHEKNGEEYNVQSIALSYEQVADVQAYVQEHEVTYPVLLGNPGMSTEWNISAYPTVYILNSKGEVASSTSGITTRQGILARLATID